MYKIKLNTFEGPLDLLLFFIRRDELDIYDIPISRITKEFIDYLNLLEKLDLEIAGDFLLMAATLMQIKVRMLLPKEIDEKGEEIDPRADLVNALIEYKRYKEMSDEFSFLEANQRKVSYRGNFEKDEIEHQPEIDTLLKNITIFDLIKAFQNAIMEKPKEVVHEVKKLNVSIDEQIVYILDKISEHNRLNFINLVKGIKEKIRIVVTFIAMLELIKMGKIGLQESPNFNDFEIYILKNG
ncbi:MAG: segregation/condensation protein A [Ignavibacteriae bacterium]|nr:segregation/condensation protein A [Ignavibacteriota bacterium]MCB9209858.1 segregation/condensation protein A [Ignavibacteriales bacterium]MCB9219015.1 segregation/condensation protein A [Ignavibacteriales bacterium]